MNVDAESTQTLAAMAAPARKTGFLEKHTSSFMKSLWELLISAQQNPLGIPGEFLEAKKEEIRKKKEEQVPRASRQL